jgi:hypothetical protein
VLSEGLLAKMPYSACATSRSLYLFSLYSIKYADCVHYNVCYNGNFLADDFDYLTIEQKKLEVA